MELWRQLYALIWLAFLQIIIIVVLEPTGYILTIHVFLGIAVLGLAYFNHAKMKKTAAPDRLRRIVKSTSILARAQPVLGILLYLEITLLSTGFVEAIIRFSHVTVALAIITQASSVATAYDMWEEHEYAPAVRSKV